MRPPRQSLRAVLDDTEVVPESVDRAVDGAAAREIGERAIEFTHGQIAMPAPAEEQRVVRLDLEPSRERRDGFAKLPRTGLGDAEVDDARNVFRVGFESGSRALDGVRIGKRAILHAVGRPVLHRLRACLARIERRSQGDRRGDDGRQCGAVSVSKRHRPGFYWRNDRSTVACEASYAQRPGGAMEGSKRIRLLTLTMSIGVLAGASGTSQSGRPSATALEVTAYRAIGAKHPDPAIRNADVLAERLLGADERAILKETGSEVVLAALAMDTDRAWASLGSRSVFARGVHIRTRHIDEVLVESLKAGSTQVVILGAGLDSRAYRFGDALRGARVFELDLPQTQEYKKARVRDVLGSLPHARDLRSDRLHQTGSRRRAHCVRLRPDEDDHLHLGRRHHVHSRGSRRRHVARHRQQCR